MVAERHLSDSCLQVAQYFDHAGVVSAMEGCQFVEDVMAALDGGMAKHLPASHHLEGDATETQTDLDACVPRVFALSGPLCRQHLEVVVADDQVFGDAEDGGAEGAIADADERAIGFVYFVALITARAQSGASADGLGVGLVLDRPCFGGEVGGADDVDAGERQQ